MEEDRMDNALEDSEDDEESSSETSTVQPDHGSAAMGSSMKGSYRRPSFATAGPRAIVVPTLSSAHRPHLTKQERQEVREEERSLLRDNDVIPPKHPRKGSDTVAGRIVHHLPVGIPGGNRKVVWHGEQTTTPVAGGRTVEASETTALLGDPEQPYGGQDTPENINRKWEEAVAAGLIKTTWQREAKVIGKYSAPLVVTFLLQYSLTVASIFTVGHLGKVELGAVSLASMTANITGFAVYQGLVTSLDTLCAQAYGSGRKKLVGLQMQRMIYFLWLITIPIAVLWLNGEAILRRIVPDPEIAVLAGRYLKILAIGAPGYACFESGKRFVQAQGLFSASLYVLLFCAPLNAFMNWLFVWVSRSNRFPNVPQPFTLTTQNPEIQMGFHRRPHRRRRNRPAPPPRPLPLRPLRQRPRLLERLHTPRLPKLGPHDPPRNPRPHHGGSGMARFRNPHPRSLLPRHHPPRRPIRRRHPLRRDLSNPLPRLHSRQHAHRQPHRRHPLRRRENFRKSILRHFFRCRHDERHPPLLSKKLSP